MNVKRKGEIARTKAGKDTKDNLSAKLILQSLIETDIKHYSEYTDPRIMAEKYLKKNPDYGATQEEYIQIFKKYIKAAKSKPNAYSGGDSYFDGYTKNLRYINSN